MYHDRKRISRIGHPSSSSPIGVGMAVVETMGCVDVLAFRCFGVGVSRILAKDPDRNSGPLCRSGSLVRILGL